MKVLLAGTLSGKGGIQSHLTWLSTALGEAQVETLVVSLGKNRHLLEDSKTVRFISYPDKGNRYISKWLKSIEFKSVLDDFSPDIYVAVGIGWNLVIPVLLSASKPRRIFHEVMSGVPYSWRDPRWGMKLTFDEVVGQSATVAKTFIDKFGWQKPVPVLPAMPEPLEMTATLPNPTFRKVKVGEVKAALFSRLAPYKQAFWLVQQWDVLKDVLGELHIHGTGPDEPLIRNYIESKKIGDRVKCFGRYPEGQAYVDLLRCYDLTLLPTIGAEGAPLVLLESMACGVPFVAYSVGGISDYSINNPDCLIVPPQDDYFISGIKQMVQHLVNGEVNPSRLQQFYLNHYSYEILKKAWLSYLFSQKK